MKQALEEAAAPIRVWEPAGHPLEPEVMRQARQAPTGCGMIATRESCSHGAGRRMSRGDRAPRLFSVEDHGRATAGNEWTWSRSSPRWAGS